ncbi:MAG: hypothetical protein SF066_04190 [Thermoanaerobaculia bacterium]|nr:hypothetical protein [Thermoanaerobaculia bacterium]
MRSSRFTAMAALLLLLANGPLAAAAAAPKKAPAATKPAKAQTDGKKLLDSARQAVAGIYKAAKASQGKLDPKNKKQAPLWQAVKQMGTTLEKVKTQVAAKDKNLAATLSKGSETLAKLKTVWPRVGVANPKVSAYIDKLDNAYTALRSARGAEGGRARKAGPLTAQETARFEKMKSSQAEFSKKVGDLQAKAKAKKDKGTEASLARLLEKSNRIAAAQLTVDAFLLAILLLDQLQGEWEGYSYYVGPDYRTSWIEIDVWVETSFTSYDSWYVESFESYSLESCASWETSFELSEGFDYEITDVTMVEVDSLETEFEASFTYDELSYESYSEEYASAEWEETVYEEADENLDVAAESWEEEGLEVEADEEMLDEDDLEEFDDEEEEVDEEDADEGEDEEDADEGEDEGDEEEGDEEEGDEGEEDADEAEDEGDEGDEEEGDEEDEGGDEEEDAEGDEEEDEGDEGGDEEEEEAEEEEAEEDGGDEGGDEGDEEPPVAIRG